MLRAEFLGSRRHFEGLKRIGQEPTSSIYELWLVPWCCQSFFMAQAFRCKEKDLLREFTCTYYPSKRGLCYVFRTWIKAHTEIRKSNYVPLASNVSVCPKSKWSEDKKFRSEICAVRNAMQGTSIPQRTIFQNLWKRLLLVRLFLVCTSSSAGTLSLLIPYWAEDDCWRDNTPFLWAHSRVLHCNVLTHKADCFWVFMNAIPLDWRHHCFHYERDGREFLPSSHLFWLSNIHLIHLLTQY
jgi:hypothetical protein